MHRSLRLGRCRKNLPLCGPELSLSNPYSPPNTTVAVADRQPFPLGPVIGIFFGGLLLVGLIGSLGYITFLYLAYPGLIDPPSKPVDYWPEIGVFVHQILAGLFAVVGIPTFWLSLSAYRRRTADSSA